MGGKVKNNLIKFIPLQIIFFSRMRVITITSDWSKNDYYLPALKGKILSYDPASVIVDITNSIPSLDVLQSIFVLKNSYSHFPKGSIHLLCVDCEPTPEEPLAIAEYDGHYFVGKNDGRFVHLFENMPPLAYALRMEEPFSTFMAADAFLKGVRIINEQSFIKETDKCELKTEVVFRPVCTEDSIIGRVIYIDSYGNAIVNISKTLFQQMRKTRDFEILLQGPYAKIPTLSRDYSSVPQGEMVAFFNSLGLLEVAINKGNIASMEDLRTSSEITIRFFTDSSFTCSETYKLRSD